MKRPAGLFVFLFVVASVVALHGTFLDRQAGAAAIFTPDDAGRVGQPAGWTQLQWNFVGPYGVDAPHAWGNLIAAGAAGGASVTVAVLDTGVAVPATGRSTRGSPDLNAARFVPGYDFVDNDPSPYDQNGHGTHVASTIAEQTDNGYGLTGLAYGVKIMPVRVLDRTGAGDAVTIARGLRFAVDHGAKVVNLSLNFGGSVNPSQIRGLLAALAYAHRRGTLVVAGAGNDGDPSVTYPAFGPHVVAVGATTDDGCLANYSNHGAGLDLVAPGGGTDARFPDDPTCRTGRRGSPIYQVTLSGPYLNHFDITGYVGTSMAAPHVSATAALVIASRVIGDDPAPAAIEKRLEHTARDLGRPGYDAQYGWGLADAAAATTPDPGPQRPPPTALGAVASSTAEVVASARANIGAHCPHRTSVALSLGAVVVLLSWMLLVSSGTVAQGFEGGTPRGRTDQDGGT